MSKELGKLHELIDQYFNEEEVKTLCLALNIDYDNLAALGKVNKVRELVTLMARTGRLDQLVGLCAKARPHIDWSQITTQPNLSSIIQQQIRQFVRLPTTGKEFLGRKNELFILNKAWEDTHTHIITLVAWGGVGKSALVNEWLYQLARDNYQGAECVYGWSFYSQGTREDRQVSGDEFLAHALKWFGDDNPDEGSPWDKGIRLAELIRRQQTLLVLDGLEPLQHPPGERQGFLKDQGLEALLKQLAHYNTGLCVISTREEIKDLESSVGRSTVRVSLDNLSGEAGLQLLREMGVTKGSDEELKSAVQEYHGHALALVLLGRYLAVRFGGDVRKRDSINRLIVNWEEKGHHVLRIMRAYEIWLKGRPELDILYLMGLFDRPADRAAVEKLRQAPEIPGLTTKIQNLSDEEWDFAIAHLRDLRLLSAKEDIRPDTLDCHPLIREYFGERLRTSNIIAWQQANSRLYEYYINLPTKHFPDTLEEMAPLYAAVSHGCQAGRYHDALYDVFIERIRRDKVSYSLFRLGAVGADLSALANFFTQRFTEPIQELDMLERAYVLNEVGSAFRILGRLDEAVVAVEQSFQIYSSNQKDQLRIARSARNLSKIYMQLGRLEEAVEVATKTVNLSIQSGDISEQYISHATLGRAFHLLGKIKDAMRHFEEANKLRTELDKHESGQASWRGRFTLQESHYCDFLLDEGNVVTAENLLKNVTKTSKEALGLLDYAVYHYSWGRVILGQYHENQEVDLDRATKHLDEAIENLKKVDRQDELGFAFLIRSALNRLQGNISQAEAELNVAQEIAQRGNIKIVLADYQLEACRLHMAKSQHKFAITYFNNAKALIEELRYGRREREIEILKANID